MAYIREARGFFSCSHSLQKVKGGRLTSPHKSSLLDSSLASSYTRDSTSKLRYSVASLWPPLSSLFGVTWHVAHVPCPNRSHSQVPVLSGCQREVSIDEKIANNRRMAQKERAAAGQANGPPGESFHDWLHSLSALLLSIVRASNEGTSVRDEEARAALAMKKQG